MVSQEKHDVAKHPWQSAHASARSPLGGKSTQSIMMYGRTMWMRIALHARARGAQYCRGAD